MRKNKEIEVGGTRYFVTEYSPTHAIPLLTKLTKLIGQPGALLVQQNGLKKDVGEVLLAEAVGALSDRLDPDQMVPLMKDILHGTLVLEAVGEKTINREILFDLDFEGKLPQLFMLIGEIVRFQFASFFDAVAAPIRAAMAKAPKTVKSTVKAL